MKPLALTPGMPFWFREVRGGMSAKVVADFGVSVFDVSTVHIAMRPSRILYFPIMEEAVNGR